MFKSVLSKISLIEVHRKEVGNVNSVLEDVCDSYVRARELSGLIFRSALTTKLNSARFLNANYWHALWMSDWVAENFVEEGGHEFSSTAVCLGAQLPQLISFV